MRIEVCVLTVTVINHWRKLPGDMVDAPSLTSLINKAECLYKTKCHLLGEKNKVVSGKFLGVRPGWRPGRISSVDLAGS